MFVVIQNLRFFFDFLLLLSSFLFSNLNRCKILPSQTKRYKPAPPEFDAARRLPAFFAQLLTFGDHRHHGDRRVPAIERIAPFT